MKKVAMVVGATALFVGVQERAYAQGFFESAEPEIRILYPVDGSRLPASAARALPVQMEVNGVTVSPYDHRVAITVNGRRFITLDSLRGTLRGLSTGRQHITAQLLDKRGNRRLEMGASDEVTFQIGTPRQSAPLSVAPSRAYSSVAQEAAAPSPSQPRRYGTGSSTAGAGPAVNDPSGFSVRTGGRREGPVPNLDAPSAPQRETESRTEQRINGPRTEAQQSAAEEPNEPKDKDQLAPRAEQGRTNSDDRQSTVSEAMRSRLNAAGQRLANRNAALKADEEPTVTVRGDKPTTAATRSEDRASTRSESAER